MAARIDLARDGLTDYRIIVARSAAEQERYAAQELARFLYEVTGAGFPIEDETAISVAADRHLIFVGYGPHLKDVAADLTIEDLGDEGFTISTRGSCLIIVGGRPRGTLYGVYTFLEDHVGCRWYTSQVSRIPRYPDLTIGPIQDRQVPRLDYRDVYYYDAFDADWAVRNKCNGWGARLDAKRGGKITYKGRLAHTFFELVPPRDYFREHPEYFSEIDGKRQWDVTGRWKLADAALRPDLDFWEGITQLCLTNPDLPGVVAARVREWLRESPEANIVSVSSNDTYIEHDNRCQCKSCLALEKEEGGPAGPLIHFVNRVAELLAHDFPGLVIDTLAYHYTRKPPLKVRPRHNVIVRLCDGECSFLHPLTHEVNRPFHDDLIAWFKLTDRIFIWDYVTRFDHYLQPYPNLMVLAPNIIFFVEHGVRGIFEEGSHNSPGGEFAELRAWLLAKLLWDPYRDFGALVADFLDGYYGAAASHIKEYIDFIHARAAKTLQFLGLHSSWNDSFLNEPDTMAKALALFTAAEESVKDDPDHFWRVRLARLPIDYVRLVAWKSLQTAAKAIGCTNVCLVEPDLKNLAAAFFAVADHWDIEKINESRPLQEFRAQLTEQINCILSNGA